MSNLWYINPSGGSDSNNGNSFATAVKTISWATSGHGVVSGDTVKVMQSPSPTSLGQNAQWTDGSNTVTLTSAVTANVSLCEAAFTAATNITTSTSTDRRQGNFSSQFIVGGGFTTGLMGYQAFASTSFASYTQLSFMIKVSADVPANTLKLALCSDSAGATIVNSVTIAETIKAGAWTPIAIDTGGALGATIQSVALYALLNPGTIMIQLDNILACKPPASVDSVTLLSFIGKNTAGETWWGIESVNGTTITLERDPQSGTPGQGNGYSGTTASVTTWKREAFQTPLLAIGNGSNAANVSVAGVIFSGGWDSTAMTTQVGDTWFDGRNGGGIGLNVTGQNTTTVTQLSFNRYYDGIYVQNSQTFNLSSAAGLNNNNHRGLNTQLSSASNITGINLSVVSCVANADTGMYLAGLCNGPCTLGVLTLSSNGVDGLFTVYPISSSNGGFGSLIQTGALNANRNSSYGLEMGAANQLDQVTLNLNGIGASTAGSVWYVRNRVNINSLTTSGNRDAAILLQGVPNFKVEAVTSTSQDFLDANASNGWWGDYDMVFMNPSISGGVFAKNLQQATPGIPASSSRVRFHRVGGVPTNNQIIGAEGIIVSQTTTIYAPGTMAWTMTPQQAWVNQNTPFRESIRQAACIPGTVTFTVALYRTSANISAQLRIPGGRVGGVPSDVVVVANGTPNQWNLFTITASPTENGVLQLLLETWSTTTTDSVIVGQVTVGE